VLVKAITVVDFAPSVSVGTEHPSDSTVPSTDV